MGRPWAPPTSSGVPQTAHPSGVLTSPCRPPDSSPGWACPGHGPWGVGSQVACPGPQCPGLCADLRRGPPTPGVGAQGSFLSVLPPSPEAKYKQTPALWMVAVGPKGLSTHPAQAPWAAVPVPASPEDTAPTSGGPFLRASGGIFAYIKCFRMVPGTQEELYTV